MKRTIQIIFSAGLALALAGQAVTATGQEIPSDLQPTLSMEDILKYKQWQQYQQQWQPYQNVYPQLWRQIPGINTGDLAPYSSMPGPGIGCVHEMKYYSPGAVIEYPSGFKVRCVCTTLYEFCEWEPYNAMMAE